jgi:hypothetical protein
MPKNLTPEDRWETDFEVPVPGEPRRIGPLEVLFQRLLNRTERLRSVLAAIMGVPWGSPPPTDLATLKARVDGLETAGPEALDAHRSAAVLDHPDGSVTSAKLAPGAVTPDKLAPGATPYDVAVYRPGRPAGGETLILFSLPRAWTTKPGHSAVCRVAPTSNWTAAIYRNNDAVGSVTILANSTTGSVQLGEITFNPGDVLRIVAPSSADANLQDVSICIRGAS